jgi:mRNA N6-methyladenine demethylase
MTMVKRLVRWNVLPATCVPDSCIVNIYEPEDCIPPHIDSHDFVRPFCTVSFLSECNILFGTTLKVAAPGEFIGSYAIPLPVGYVAYLDVLFRFTSNLLVLVALSYALNG